EVVFGAAAGGPVGGGEVAGEVDLVRVDARAGGEAVGVGDGDDDDSYCCGGPALLRRAANYWELRVTREVFEQAAGDVDAGGLVAVDGGHHQDRTRAGAEAVHL